MIRINELELLLFLSNEPLPIKRAAQILECSPKQVINYAQALETSYREHQSFLCVRHFDDFLQLSTHPRAYELVERFMGEDVARSLGKSSMEVLSIIAYEQPITKAQIDHKRGVSSDYSLRLLLEKELIDAKEDKSQIGHPKLYTTTKNFLKYFGLQTLSDLSTCDSKHS